MRPKSKKTPTTPIRAIQAALRELGVPIRAEVASFAIKRLGAPAEPAAFIEWMGSRTAERDRKARAAARRRIGKTIAEAWADAGRAR